MAEKHSLDQTQFEEFGQSRSEQKRIKLEDQVENKSGGPNDPHNAPASRVVHARAVPDGCTHTQMVAMLQKYGKISYVTMMPRLRQALIEFENLDDALNCVQTCQANQVYILDRPVFFNFSTSQEITRSPYGIIPGGAPPAEIIGSGGSGGSGVGGTTNFGENHILLFTIFNPLYPITVDVIRTICSPYGFVQRIVIFRKNGLQVLVEFESDASASRAKQQLDGADIYAGCCTLKIEYAKTQKLNVYKNDEMTWDFTAQGRQLQSTFGGRMQQGMRGNIPPFAHAGTVCQLPSPSPLNPSSPGAPAPSSGSYNVVGTPAMAGTGSVLMLYGLSQGKINCEHIFNLLCSYGNVLKVKMLMNKPGTAMAHLDSPQGAKNAIHHLHGHKLLEQTLELNYSRHSYIADYSQGGSLPDGSPCWKDFSQSRNNRFLTVEGTSKNRIVAPAKILHFYNGPPDSTDENIRELFEKVGGTAPIGTKFFSQGSSCKSATGLMEWPDIDMALDAFVLGNHHTLFAKNGQAYTFKMAFSSNQSLEQHGPGGGGGVPITT